MHDTVTASESEAPSAKDTAPPKTPEITHAEIPCSTPSTPANDPSSDTRHDDNAGATEIAPPVVAADACDKKDLDEHSSGSCSCSEDEDEDDVKCGLDEATMDDIEIATLLFVTADDWDQIPKGAKRLARRAKEMEDDACDDQLAPLQKLRRTYRKARLRMKVDQLEDVPDVTQMSLMDSAELAHITNLERVARSTAELMDAETWKQVPRDVRKHAECITRLSPWYTGDIGEAMGVLRDMYALKLEVHKKEIAREAYKEKTKSNAQTQQRVAASGSPELGSMSPQADQPTQTGDRALVQAKRAERRNQKNPPVDVDESRIPYMAWALHENAEDRVKAAFKHMQTFARTKKTLADEPMLAQAEVTALELIAKGGRAQEEIGSDFLKLYRQMKYNQAESAVKGKGKAKAVDAPERA